MKLERGIAALTVAFVLIVLILNMGRPIFTDDLWWHLRLGEVILDQGFPDRDPLLFTAVDSPPFLHEWLFQVFVAIADDLGGLYSLRFLHVALGLLVVIAAYRFERAAGLSRTAAMVGVVVLFLLAYQRLIQLRPQLLSMALFFFTLVVLMRPGGLTRRSAVGLMALTAVWANIHSIFVIVFPFWGILILAQASTLQQVRGLRWHFVGFAGSLLCGLANPRGIDIYLFYFKHNAVNPAQAVVDDFGHYFPWEKVGYLPQSSLPANLVFVVICILFAVMAAGLLRDWYKRGRSAADGSGLWMRPFLALAGGLAIAMMVYAIRFTWLIPLPFAFVAAEIRRHDWAQSLGAPARIAVVTTLAIASTAHYLHPTMDRYAYRLRSWADFSRFASQAYDKAKFRDNAAEFLDRIGVGGNLYNPYALGGFLAWRLGPEYRTFIDGRQDRYPRQVFEDYFIISRGAPETLEAIRRYPFDFFFVPVSDGNLRLRIALGRSGWARVFQDRQVAIFASPETFDRPLMSHALAAYYHLDAHDQALASPRAFGAWLEESIVAEAFTDPSHFDSLSFEAWRRELNTALRYQFFNHAESLAHYGERRWGIAVMDSPEWRRINELR